MSETRSFEVRIYIAHGRVMGYRGIRFGGVACSPAVSGKSARIRVAVRHRTGELVADLREGDTVQIAGQTWRLLHANGEGERWRAVLIGSEGP